VKQLKEFLKKRGLECKGCSEKSDFINMAYENREKSISVPPPPPEQAAEPGVNVPDGEKIDQAKLDEVSTVSALVSQLLFVYLVASKYESWWIRKQSVFQP
jgi:hypothetical protein